MQELLDAYLSGSKTTDELIDVLQTLDQKAINSPYEGWALIHYAAKKRDAKLLKFLVEKNIDLAAKTEDGENILHLALQTKNCDLDFIVVAWAHLLNSGINLFSQKDTGNKTPFEYLSSVSHPQIFGNDSSRILTTDLVSEEIAKEFGIFNSCFLFKEYSEDQLKNALKSAIDAGNDSFVYEFYNSYPKLSYPIIYQHLFLQSSGKDLSQFSKMQEVRNQELKFLEKAKSKDFDEHSLNLFRINVNCLDQEGHNALEFAASHQNIKFCAYLISEGIDVEIGLCPSFCNLPKNTKDSVAALVNWRLEYTDERLSQKLNTITIWQEADGFNGDKISIRKTTPIFEEDFQQVSIQERLEEISLKKIYDEIFDFSQSSLVGVAEYFKLLAELVALDESLRINIDHLKGTLIRSYSSVETARGNTVSGESEIYIAAKDLEFNPLVGIIAHEMCHFACYKIWENGCKPYKSGSAEERRMSAIYDSLLAKFNDLPTRNQMNPTLKSAFELYQGDGKEKVIKELIVRVPQIILENGHTQPNGLQILRDQAPELLSYYQEIFIPKAKEYIQSQKSEIIEGKISRITDSKEEREEKAHIKSLQKELDKALRSKDYVKSKEINGQIANFIEQKLEKKRPSEAASKPKIDRSCDMVNCFTQ